MRSETSLKIIAPRLDLARQNSTNHQNWWFGRIRNPFPYRLFGSFIWKLKLHWRSIKEVRSEGYKYKVEISMGPSSSYGLIWAGQLPIKGVLFDALVDVHFFPFNFSTFIRTLLRISWHSLPIRCLISPYWRILLEYIQNKFNLERVNSSQRNIMRLGFFLRKP